MLADFIDRLRQRMAQALRRRRRAAFRHRGDPRARRRAETDSDRVLMPATLHWLELLPEYARPQRFSERFPRIVNRFAVVWADRKLCKRYFESLLGDERGSRAGFGPEVRKEILRLRVFYETTMGDASAEEDWKQRAAAHAERPVHEPHAQPRA